jgi:coenzyme F420-reducing hydrogenase alpha subunit
VPELEWGQAAARRLFEWLAAFPFPEFERDYEFVALEPATEYPFSEGRIVSSRGLSIEAHEYDAHFEERQVPHSNALHSVLRERGAYLCGPLARFNLNFDKLPSDLQIAARAAALFPPCKNPFKSVLVRALEIAFAFDEALRVIREYRPPREPSVAVPEHAATGYAATEAPRGLLYHRYHIDEQGLITDAKIVPPTSQNQTSIEEDLVALAPSLFGLDDAEAARRAEHAIRNHDPCISCATHFLKLRREYA